MPRQKKLLADAAAEAVKGVVGTNQRGDAGKKRAWKEHADNYFANNQAWEEVNGIYMSCLDLLRTATALSPLLREVKLLKHVKNIKLLTRNIKAINRDTAVLADVLAKVRAKYSTKTGGTQDQLEMLDSCAAFSEYVDFMERYDSALMPLVVHASEQLEEAMNSLAQTDPELAITLKNNLNGTLAAIRSIVHDTTGADPIVTPGTEVAANEAAPVEAAA
jgi:hypothetical protein